MLIWNTIHILKVQFALKRVAFNDMFATDPESAEADIEDI